MTISLVDMRSNYLTVISDKIFYDTVTKSVRFVDTNTDIWKVQMSREQYDKLTEIDDYVDLTDYTAEIQSEYDYARELAEMLDVNIHDEENPNCNYDCKNCCISHCCDKQFDNYDPYLYDYSTQDKMRNLVKSAMKTSNFGYWTVS